MTPVVLSLGSNMGESRALLESAVADLRGLLQNLQVSRFYRTAPLYNTDQPDFLNLAVLGQWGRTPEELLDTCQALEQGAQRVRSAWKGPRTLDIDLVLFGREIIQTSRLTVPHPGLEDRAFVLIPLLDLLPQGENPRTGRTFRQALEDLIRRVGDQGVVPLG